MLQNACTTRQTWMQGEKCTRGHKSSSGFGKKTTET
ncbi:hypothetical protein T4C_11602 [Trichinella pseudospiralis]|uniref:Uncharacterized protein n=1 Tax=Trichinella pseudospiralis TaxID=6337 RepID=A0A0V1G7T5_TRIPS|nr:hypothetical protein T4C_11602 [Trichinella pseudospiralis]